MQVAPIVKANLKSVCKLPIPKAFTSDRNRNEGDEPDSVGIAYHREWPLLLNGDLDTSHGREPTADGELERTHKQL